MCLLRPLARTAPTAPCTRTSSSSILRDADGLLDDVVVDRLAKAGINTVRLAVRNPSDRNLSAVRLMLTITAASAAYDAEELKERTAVKLPAPPSLIRAARLDGISGPSYIGPDVLAGFTTPPVFRPFAVDIAVDAAGSTRLVFHLGDVRPRDRVELDPFVLVVPVGSPTPVQATWTATSTGVDAVQEGSFTFPLRTRVLSPLDVVR